MHCTKFQAWSPGLSLINIRNTGCSPSLRSATESVAFPDHLTKPPPLREGYKFKRSLTQSSFLPYVKLLSLHGILTLTYLRVWEKLTLVPRCEVYALGYAPPHIREICSAHTTYDGSKLKFLLSAHASNINSSIEVLVGVAVKS